MAPETSCRATHGIPVRPTYRASSLPAAHQAGALVSRRIPCHNFEVVPILAGIDLHLGNAEDTHAYLGFNAGAYYARQRLDIGLWSIDEDNWHFGVAPEAGVVVPVRYDTDICINARYHDLFSAGEYLGD